MKTSNNHFIELLENIVVKTKIKGTENEREVEDMMKRKEEKEAPEKNSIENEVWRLMAEEISEVFYKLINRIWTEGEIPKEWNREIIFLVYKKRNKS